MKKLSLICAALLLSACGGGGGSAGTRPTPTPLPTPGAEAFYLRVLAVIRLAPEDTEAAEVADIPVSAPEDSEPPGI